MKTETIEEGSIIKIETIIPMKREKFLNIIFDDKFNEFQAEVVGLKLCKTIDTKTNDTIITKKVRVQPDVTIPTALSWMIGSDVVEYLDVKTMDTKTNSMTFKTIPPVFKDTLLISGTIDLEDIKDQPKKCKQVSYSFIL